MKTWFSSDSHWSHANIIKFCNRPFIDVDEMDRVMVERWNAVVGVDDDVYHLGDFSFRDGYKFFHQLNGQKHLIIGNHDGDKVRALPWKSQEVYLELKLPDAKGKKHTIILFHYPIEDFNGLYKGNIHLHGHVHGNKLNAVPRRIDVGVDCHDFTPISFERVLELIED